MAGTPFFAPYRWLTGRPIAGLGQRLGIFNLNLKPGPGGGARLWFHAASVGEVQAALSLVAALKKDGLKAEIIVTSVTEQGLLAAKRIFGGSATCLYAPLDLPWVVKRFLRQLKPSAYLCLETELWPVMLRLAKAQGIPALLVNGRLSERSFRRYARLSGLTRETLACFDRAAVCQEDDRQRYQALGMAPERLAVCGNAKYDLTLADLCRPEAALAGLDGEGLRATAPKFYRKLLGLGDQPVLIAGSTHSGEEELLLAAWQALRADIPDLILIVAPRHLERLGTLAGQWRAQGLKFQTTSQLRAGQGRESDLLLLDRMGELARLYAVATYVFCGGSLTPKGGHNLMEPALWGKPPLFGPHMQDFADARLLLEGQGAGFTVRDGQELRARILHFHQHHDQYHQAAQGALAITAAQQGAASRQAELIRQALNLPRHNRIVETQR